MRSLAIVILLAGPLLAGCAARDDRWAAVYPWDQVKPTGAPCVDWLQLPRVNGVILGPNRNRKSPGCIDAPRNNIIDRRRRNIIITTRPIRAPARWAEVEVANAKTSSVRN